MATIEERVKKIVADQLDQKPEAIKNDAGFVGDLGADSLDTVELVMAIEEEFDIEIQDEDAESLKTTQDVIDYIRNNQK
ncbi:acyl carrier protein 1 [Aspergillus pseudonomiae]|uniref:Acyl carrier protein n=1 Tax=Aspergillus pseudonomiae TaxID=1506151 RepID=A0A5N7CW44_9EURO|nr:acyl carrier protein 1 [Aspergillus pseudonomiae]KAB8261723.1 acyl carrier protein 1 [Aspergillus pseudonomiae]KAE8398394.1 acyl carrier protein 1 [Aspergillus pseudonomiae]